MKALISPNEVYTVNNITGARVVEIATQDFPIASPLFWLDVDDTITTEYLWDPVLGLRLPQPEPTAPIALTQITRRQFFRALYTLDLLQSVLAIIETAPVEVRLDFENATTFERADQGLIDMAYALGKTDNDIDALFTLASTY